MNTAVHRKRYLAFFALLVYLSRLSTIDGKRLPYLDEGNKIAKKTKAASSSHASGDIPVFKGRLRYNRFYRGVVPRRKNVTDGAETVPQGCRIDEAEIQQIYDEGTKTWTLSDETLKRNAMDVQRFVDCATDDDTLLFVTESRIQPHRHIVINKRLTLTGAAVNGRKGGGGGARRSNSDVSFTCPSELEGVFVIESAGVVVKNLIIEDCKLESHSPIVFSKCKTETKWSPIVLSNLVFRRNSNFNGPSVLAVKEGCCPSLSLDDVTLRSNTCYQNTAAMNLKARFVAQGQECEVLRVHDCYVSVRDSRFIKNASGRMSDGTIQATHSVLKIRECQFIKNRGSQAGALSLVDGVVANIESSKFHRNSASGSGGVIMLMHSVLNGNEISALNNTAAASGGFMMASWGKIHLSNSTFARHSSNEGAVFSTLNSTFVGEHLTLQDNEASGTGGGLFLVGGTTTLKNSVLKRNVGAYAGGGALSGINGEITVENVLVLKNRALGNGGGGIETQGVNMYLSDSVFQSNKGPSGGALRFHGGITRASRVTLEKNKATMRGGAIYSDTCHILFQDSTFAENIAMEGGAICAEKGRFEGTQIDIVRNHATLNGGGAYFCTTKARLTSSLLENNTALYGGAIHVLNSMFSGQDLTVRQNAAELDGGGFFIYHASAFLRESIFEGNRAGENGDKAITTKRSRLRMERVEIEGEMERPTAS